MTAPSLPAGVSVFERGWLSSNNILNKGKYKFAFVLLKQLESGDTFMIQYKSNATCTKSTTKRS